MSRLALRLGVAAGAALLCSAADRSDLTPAFTGTIVSTYPDGRTAELWLSADGTYTGEGRRHGRSAGRWTIRGQRICLRQTRPPTLPFSYCTAIPSGGLGPTWSAKAVTGETIRVKLEAGGR